MRGCGTVSNVMRGCGTVSKCLRGQSSKHAVKRILGERNLSRAGLSLYIPLAQQQQDITRIIFQRSVLFFIQTGLLCFMYGSSGGNRCVGAASVYKFTGRISFQWENQSRMPNAGASCKHTIRVQTEIMEIQMVNIAIDYHQDCVVSLSRRQV